MKLDNDVRNIQKEALVVVSKATELFLSYLGARSSQVRIQFVLPSWLQVAVRNKRKTIKETDLLEVIHGFDSLIFLHSDFPRSLTKTSRSRMSVDEDENSSHSEKPKSDSAANISNFFAPKKLASTSET
jgi:histone H3/H4